MQNFLTDKEQIGKLKYEWKSFNYLKKERKYDLTVPEAGKIF